VCGLCIQARKRQEEADPALKSERAVKKNWTQEGAGEKEKARVKESQGERT